MSAPRVGKDFWGSGISGSASSTGSSENREKSGHDPGPKFLTILRCHRPMTRIATMAHANRVLRTSVLTTPISNLILDQSRVRRGVLLLLFLHLFGVAPLAADDNEPSIVRATLVPPAAIGEEIPTPRGQFRGLRSIREIRVTSKPPAGPLPEDIADEFFPDEPIPLDRCREPRMLVEWQPADVWHKPLYFEDVALEVYGASRHRLLQPFASGVRFFGTIPLLPWKMVHTPPHVHISTLGRRPSSPELDFAVDAGGPACCR